MLSKRQREQLVLELYEQGKTVREIAKQAHMSFRDIDAMIRAADEESEPKLKRTSLSKDSQASNEILGSIPKSRNIFKSPGYCLLDSAAFRAYKNESKGLFSSA